MTAGSQEEQRERPAPDTDPPAERGSSRAAVALVGGVVLTGLALRLVVMRSSAGVLNADEAYTGIETFEILSGRAPIVLGGDAYTFPFESYLLVPVVAWFGASIVPLKLISVCWWALASVVVYRLGARAGGARTGAIAAALFWITPGAMLQLSVTGYVAYASGLLVTVGAFALATRLLQESAPTDALAGGFGLAAGFGVWLHPMFLATLLPMVVTVLLVRRTARTWTLVIAGGVLGCGPLLVWNAVSGFPTFDPPSGLEGTYTDRLRTFAVDLLPRTFGLKDFGLSWELPVLGPLLYLSLLAVVLVGLVESVNRPSRPASLLLPIVVVSAFPIMALFSRLIYAADGRYGIITFPFLVLAAAIGLDALIDRAGAPTRVVVTGVMAVWALGFIAPGVQPLIAEDGRDPNADVRAVVERLDAVGIDRIVGSYWGALPVEYVADRRIVGAVTPVSTVRFPERQRMVEAAPPESVAFVFLTSDEAPEWLWLPVDSYRRDQIGRFVIYVPTARLLGDPAGAIGD